MSKLLKKIIRTSKRSTKTFFRLCDNLTRHIALYKKTLVGLTLVFIFVLLFVFGRDMIATTLAKTIVVSEGEILRRAGELTALPKTTPISIVRVKDAESLRAQHMFYKDIKEGDYILMYQDRVIIYDLRANTIIGEKSSQ